MNDPLPPNELKARLGDASGGVQWAMFVSLADPVAAEICAGAGFDLVVIDAEHGPNDLRTILVQLQSVAAAGAEAAVRCWNHDPADIKRLLDAGARTLVVPMIDTADEATAIVAATRYPPDGVRGVSSARAARWGRVPDYHATAAEQLCVIAQVESAAGLANIEEICAVDGIDAVFIGPMDLATSLGHIAGGTRPEVVEIVAGAVERIAATGMPAAVMATSHELIGRYTSAGARLVAVGVDTALLASATTALRSSLGSTGLEATTP
jgi:4-hydroxy-2-oxoheptanedioate aldolase